MGFSIFTIVIGALTLSDGVLGTMDGTSLFLPHAAVPVRLGVGFIAIVLGSLLLSRSDREAALRS